MISYSSDFRTVILEDLCLEMSSAGHGDSREPFLTVIHADGSRTSDFRYLSDSITDEKPAQSPLPGSYSEDGKTEHLTVTLQDASYGLVLELHYFVFHF